MVLSLSQFESWFCIWIIVYQIKTKLSWNKKKKQTLFYLQNCIHTICVEFLVFFPKYAFWTIVINIFCKQRADDVKYFAEDGRIENVYVEIKLDCKLQFQAKKDNDIKLQSKYGGNCVFVKTTFIYSTVSHSIICAINFEFKTDKKKGFILLWNRAHFYFMFRFPCLNKLKEESHRKWKKITTRTKWKFVSPGKRLIHTRQIRTHNRCSWTHQLQQYCLTSYKRKAFQ